MKNYYDILGLRPNASQDEIKTAYRKLTLKVHPDRNESDTYFDDLYNSINEAYEVLSIPSVRQKYDLRLKLNELSSERKHSLSTNARAINSVWDEVKTWRAIRNFLWLFNIGLLIYIIWHHEQKASVNLSANQGKVIARSGVNLRKQPSTTSEILIGIPYDETVNIVLDSSIKEYQPNSSTNWIEIEYGGVRGWVNSKYMETY